MLKALIDRVIDRHSAMVLQLAVMMVLFIIGLFALALYPGNKDIVSWVSNGSVVIAIIAILRGVQDERSVSKPEEPAKKENA